MSDNFSSVTYVVCPTYVDYVYVEEWVNTRLKTLAVNKDYYYNGARGHISIIHFKQIYTQHKKRLSSFREECVYNGMSHEQKLVHKRNKRYYDKKRAAKPGNDTR